jgi:hypothetical protein
MVVDLTETIFTYQTVRNHEIPFSVHFILQKKVSRLLTPASIPVKTSTICARFVDKCQR